MRLMKLKVLTASVMLFIGSQPANLLAQDYTASQPPANTAAPGSMSNAPTAVPAPQQAYRGNPPPRYYRGYRRDSFNPFGNSGPSFSGPWSRDRGPGSGSGSGFGFGSDSGPGWGSRRGPSWRSGPSFGSGGPSFGTDRGPRYGGWDDPYYDRGRGFYDRGPRFSGPDDWDWGGSGMGFDW